MSKQTDLLNLTDAITVDGSNNVGIGNSNPSAFNSLGASDKLVIGDSTDSNLTLFGTTYGSLAFADSDASSSTAQYAGLIQYYHADNSMQFYTGSTERMRIDAAGRVTTPYQPAFHAYGSTPTTSSHYLVYQSTDFNIGGHYSTSTGRFTAPVSGKYLLGWADIGSNTDDIHRYFLHVNGVQKRDIQLRVDTAASGIDYGTNGMFTIPWQLNTNDYVQIYYKADGGTANYGGGSSTNDYSRFWGYLIG